MIENLHNIHGFIYAFDQATLSCIQPDTSNCCGISSQHHSGWINTHSFPMYECTIGPLFVLDCLAVAPEDPGFGVTFDWDNLAPYEA